VRLGRLDAWAYRIGGARLYAVPRPHGYAIVACLAAEPDCDRLASSVSVGDALSFATLSRHRARAARALHVLENRRTRARTLLARAASPIAQKRQAKALRMAFAVAARDARGPLTNPLASSLLRTSQSYGALEAAARKRDGSAFSIAADDVRKRERDVNQSIGAFRAELAIP
jgi:hypothetical protein